MLLQRVVTMERLLSE
jgi:hypothetical protein